MSEEPTTADDDIPSAYIRNERTVRETPDQLRARIPGWGVDLDPADRPSHPKLRYAPDSTGAHWDFPERRRRGGRGSGRSSTRS